MSGVHGLENCGANGREKVGLALMLTIAEVIVFFGFILMAVVMPEIMAEPVSNDSSITVSFAYGMVILVLSVLLIGVYVVAENSNED